MPQLLQAKRKFYKVLVIIMVISPILLAVNKAVIHKFYVSLTQIEYVKEQQSLQIISRVFLDDLEDALTEFSGKAVRISSEPDNTSQDQLVENYFRSKLKFEIDGKKAPWKFVGKTIDNDMLVAYFEIEQLKKVKTIVVTNEVLFEIFDEQQNIIRTQINDQKKSFILISQDRSKVLNF